MTRKTLPPLDELPVVSKPPVESFFDSNHADIVWPRHITVRRDFRAQTAGQQELLRLVQTAFSCLPNGTTLAEGLKAGLVTEAVACNLMSSLSHYLETERAYQRVIFYLPFEFTSPIIDGSVELIQTSERFQKTYRRAWEAQLREHDVRANFVDGDVLEVEKRTGDVPRVVKATHLIPGLVQSGHLTFAEVVAYATKSTDELLKHGVLEACTVMIDSKLLNESNLMLLRHSLDPYLRRGYYHLAEQRTSTNSNEHEASGEKIRAALLAEVAKAQDLREPTVTPNRLQWLRHSATEKAVLAAAVKLGWTLGRGAALPHPGTLDNSMLRAYVEAIRLTMLQQGKLEEKYRNWLALATTYTSDQTVPAAVTKLYTHAYTVGILENKTGAAHEIHVPTLQGPFSKNLDRFTPSVAEFNQMITRIIQDTYLATRVCPVVIMFGSQLKGYGAENSDADVAVFIKPGTSLTDHAEIASRLRHIFDHERIGGSAIMFWLEEMDGRLVVTENTQTTGFPPLPSWTHVFLGGAWVGDEATTTALQHELLVPYLFNPTVTLDDKPLRERWQEEMERDSILYRLLHKGYERYYPVRSPFGSGKAIDDTSTFYDPTFRRIATLLFLTRVFLPNLGMPT